MRVRSWKRIFCSALAAAAFAAPAFAGPIAYSVERGAVHLVDLADRSVRVVAPTSLPQLYLEHLDLADDGFLYGLGGAVGTGLGLFRVDPATGAAALVAGLPDVLPNGLAATGAGSAWLAVDVAPYPGSEKVLRRLDLATGAVVEELPAATQGFLLVLFGGEDGLFALTGDAGSGHWQLERVDPATGTGVVLHDLGPVGDPLTPFVRAADDDGAGGLWVSGAWGEIILGSELFSYQRIDAQTGAIHTSWEGVVFTPTFPPLTGIAIASLGSPLEIPALGPGGLAALAGLLGLAAVAVLRRSRKASIAA